MSRRHMTNTEHHRKGNSTLVFPQSWPARSRTPPMVNPKPTRAPTIQDQRRATALSAHARHSARGRTARSQKASLVCTGGVVVTARTLPRPAHTQLAPFASQARWRRGGPPCSRAVPLLGHEDVEHDESEREHERHVQEDGGGQDGDGDLGLHGGESNATRARCQASILQTPAARLRASVHARPTLASLRVLPSMLAERLPAVLRPARDQPEKLESWRRLPAPLAGSA